MRKRPPWRGYDRMAATGQYGALLNEAGDLSLTEDGKNAAAFVRSVLTCSRRVLDLGCGPGFPSLVLADVGRTVFGLDASPAMLGLAQVGISRLGIANVVLVRALAEALPFPNGAFDGTALCGTLGSVTAPDPVLSEVRRVTSPGAPVASIEQDFRHRLTAGRPRAEHRWRRDAESLRLEVVRYLANPYRIYSESYVIDAGSKVGRQILAHPELQQEGRTAADLSPRDLPPQAILDAFSEEEAQFDPSTLREAFEQAGFETVDIREAPSYGVPHVFGVFRRR